MDDDRPEIGVVADAVAASDHEVFKDTVEGGAPGPDEARKSEGDSFIGHEEVAISPDYNSNDENSDGYYQSCSSSGDSDDAMPLADVVLNVFPDAVDMGQQDVGIGNVKKEQAGGPPEEADVTTPPDADDAARAALMEAQERAQSRAVKVADETAAAAAANHTEQEEIKARPSPEETKEDIMADIAQGLDDLKAEVGEIQDDRDPEVRQANDIKNIELTETMRGWLQNPQIAHYLKARVLDQIRRLGEGERTYCIAKPLKGCSLPIYETRVSYVHQIGSARHQWGFFLIHCQSPAGTKVEGSVFYGNIVVTERQSWFGKWQSTKKFRERWPRSKKAIGN